MTKKTHKEFLKELQQNQLEVFNTIIEFIDEYKTAKIKIKIRDKYGTCLIRPDNLLHGKIPSIKSAIDKNSYFIAMLRDKNIKIFNHIIKIGEYRGMLNDIYIDTIYGKCKMVPTSILSGSIPSMKSAINKIDYIKRYLKINYKEVSDAIIEYGDYNGYHNHMLVRTNYGWCNVEPANLLIGKHPSIQSAINKNEYFVNIANDKYGNFYDYSEINYINRKVKIKIICPIHGEFWQVPNNHLSGYGCTKCGILNLVGGYNKCTAEKNLDDWKKISAIVYKIKIYDNEEVFYKIGITTKTVEERFGGCLPYAYNIIEIIETNLYEAIYIENKLHKLNKLNHYEPNKIFGGWTECFSILK